MIAKKQVIAKKGVAHPPRSPLNLPLHSIEPRDKIYVKGFRFLFFLKNIVKNLKSKHGLKLLDITKKSATDAVNTDSKTKTADAIGHQTGNKISVRIKKGTCKDQIKCEAPTQIKETSKPVETPKQIYTLSEK